MERLSWTNRIACSHDFKMLSFACVCHCIRMENIQDVETFSLLRDILKWIFCSMNFDRFTLHRNRRDVVIFLDWHYLFVQQTFTSFSLSHSLILPSFFSFLFMHHFFDIALFHPIFSFVSHKLSKVSSYLPFVMKHLKYRFADWSLTIATWMVEAPGEGGGKWVCKHSAWSAMPSMPVTLFKFPEEF